MGNANTKEARPEPTQRTSRTKSKPAPLIVDPSETVDGGYLFPQGIYSGAQDFQPSVVRECIISRRLAPFYKGLDDYDPDWPDARVLAEVDKAGWHPPKHERSTSELSAKSGTSSRRGSEQLGSAQSTGGQPIPAARVPSNQSNGAGTRLSSSVPRGKASAVRTRSNTTSITKYSQTEERTQTIWLYRSVHECPICFLMYPRLNSTCCCSQDICTECFVQIKRATPHPPHNQPTDQPPSYELISEPAACPYCQDRSFGVLFEAPPFEWGITKPADCSPKVISPDTLRPDWEYKLAHARRKVAKRSAAAQALHRNALLPEPGSEQEAEQQRQQSRRSGRSALSAREMERRMIQQAIQQSLREQ